MKMKMALMLIGYVFIMNACSSDKDDLPATPNDCSTTPAKFAANVSPLIQSRCAIPSCHAAGSTNAGGPFTSYDLIKAKASQIKDAVASGRMPQGSSLTAAQIKTITCWVDNGAQND